MTTVDQRERFEEEAFKMRFLMSIQKVGTGQFPFRSISCPMKSDFIARDPGTKRYKDETLNAMWWAWNKALGVDVDK